MGVHISRDITDGFDAAKLVRVDRDLVAIAENRDELYHVNRVADDLADRSSEGDLALLDRKRLSKGLDELVAHVTNSR